MKATHTTASVSLSSLLLLAITSVAQAQLTGSAVIDISGLPTGGADPLNDEVLMVDLETGGRDAIVNGVGYDVTIEAHDPSWLSHAGIVLGSFYLINPAGFPDFGGDDFPGTKSYSTGGIEDITMFPIPGGGTFDLSFPAPGGILTVALYEWVDDAPVAPDGFWGDSSTISVTYKIVPEPASIGLAGMACLSCLVLRHRRSVAVRQGSCDPI